MPACSGRMAEQLWRELKNILTLILFGMIWASLYDIFRILRRVVRHNVVAVSVEDMLYWIALTLACFLAILEINDGNFRLYLIMGMVGGAVLYRFTISSIIVKYVALLLKKIIKIVRMVIRKIRGERIAKKRKGI